MIEPLSPHFALPERASHMSIMDLDELRADIMRELLDEEGQRCIGFYDIVELKTAFRIALDDYNFDNIQFDGDGLKEHKTHALTGSGICDHPFSTIDELK